MKRRIVKTRTGIKIRPQCKACEGYTDYQCPFCHEPFCDEHMATHIKFNHSWEQYIPDTADYRRTDRIPIPIYSEAMLKAYRRAIMDYQVPEKYG